MVRVWRRRLLGGMGMAVVVPGTLLASLVLLALAGGFGGLSALGQAFSGPAAPAPALTGAPASPAGTRAVSPALIAALTAPVPASRVQGDGRPAGTSGGSPTTETGRRTPAGAAPQQQTGPGLTPRGGRTRSPGSPPQPQPTVVDRGVSAGTAVTSQVPAPAGPAATKALQAAGATLDSIAPIKSS